MSRNADRADAMRVRANLVDDTGDVQVLQVEEHGSPIPDVPHVLPYGLAVGLPRKAQGLLSSIGGAWDHLVAWGFLFAAHRPKNLAEGDVTLYSGHGIRIDLRDGEVNIVVLEGGTITLGGRAAHALLGEVTAEFLVSHTHPVIGDETGTPTGAPDPATFCSDTVLMGN
jgi:phage gp45-like